LRFWQLVDVLEQMAEIDPLVDDVCSRDPVFRDLVVHRVPAVRSRPPQVVQAAVAGNPVKPWADVEGPVIGSHRVVGGGEHLLENILRVLLGAEHVAAEGKQARPVALEQKLERAVVPASDERDQALVRLEAEQRRAANQQPAAGISDADVVHGRGTPGS
jgi:hypothetical protein